MIDVSMFERSKQPSPARWKKHLLLIAILLGTIGTFAAAIRSKPRIRLAERKSIPIDPTIMSAVRAIDGELQAAILAAGLDAAPAADWMTIGRRISLALVGTGMSLEEIRILEQIPEPERIRWWVDHLLNDSRCSDYLGERFARAYVGTNNGPFILFRRRRFRMWLSEQFQQNRPYDAIVREMISSEGLWTDHPAVNFLTATMDEQDNGRADPIRLAGRTTRAFLGMRIDCLQCHDDFLDKIKLGPLESPVDGEQHHFHELASFFSGARVSKNIFAGLRDDRQDYRFQFLNASDESVVPLGVPFHGHLLPTEGKPRHRLAAWVTHPENLPFARATVNRVWALMFGRPLVEPVDDMSLHGPFPAGLETLAQDFVAYGFDLHRLIRILTQTNAFQRDSRSPDFQPTLEHEGLWAVFPMTQLRPEQVAGSIHQACRVRTVDEHSSIVTKLEKFGYLEDFMRDYGDRGEDEFVAQSVTIPQRLLVMNGDLIKDRVQSNPIMNASNRIAATAHDNSTAIEAVYLAALNRKPSVAEVEAMSEFLLEKKGEDRANAIGGVYWVLLNSTEFLWNH